MISGYFFFNFVSHSWGIPMMKITGLSHLFKWENWWLTKYFFAPLYILYICIGCDLPVVMVGIPNRIFLRFISPTSCLRHPRQNKSLNQMEKKWKESRAAYCHILQDQNKKFREKNITEDETRSDIADWMVDSSISLVEESSKAEGSLANPSPPETMVGVKTWVSRLLCAGLISSKSV